MTKSDETAEKGLEDQNASVNTATEPEGEATERMKLAVDVSSPSACQRHVKVTIPRPDIERYFEKACGEMMGTATVPGFRSGRAPRKLVETRFRKELRDQVKGSLLLDGMSQATEDLKFTAISEPDLDPGAVELPDDGPLTFEFDIEVRPEFDLPEWKGLSIERPSRKFTEKDVDKRLEQVLIRYGRLVPHDGEAATGDYITCNLSFKGESGELSRSKEEVLRIRPVLSFRDGKIKNFDKAMKNVRAGETREAEAVLSNDAPNEALRGKKVTGVFEILEVKKLDLPKLTPEFLESLGGFASEDELRQAVRGELERQLEYHQRQSARRQITEKLTKNADWELPPAMLRRQSRRELERAVLELRRAGFSEKEIVTRENELRQNSAQATARALKEHFILERLAEENKLEVHANDYDAEVALIASQSGENPRRVRARLEKQGMMDALRNQIVERKAIELVLSHANFKETSLKLEESDDTEAVETTVGGGEEEDQIPAAQFADGGEPFRTPPERN